MVFLYLFLLYCGGIVWATVKVLYEEVSTKSPVYWMERRKKQSWLRSHAHDGTEAARGRQLVSKLGLYFFRSKL
jgi:hypothetical protein